MCGIAGTIGTKSGTAAELLARLSHRGPDDEGLYTDERRAFSFGQRRLAIIDLSPGGHQPMELPDGSAALVYNGEIYNFKALREELVAAGRSFRSASDTEVILEGYAAWGTGIFSRIDGMWALALYDRERGELHLSRDPAGVKPLYLYRKGKALAFASEIQALSAALGAKQLAVNAEALAQYLAHGYAYGSGTVYEEVTELAPGTTLTLRLSDLHEESKTHFSPAKREAPATIDKAVSEFDTLFSENVAATLQADVPVGLFLSGGVDSALVGYYLKKAGASLQSFTIGFGERSFDESSTASRIAAHLGFPHTVAMMKGSDIASDTLAILDAFGEPFADMSALPTYYLSKLAREAGYKVALAGDGADELFGGYPTHYLPSVSRWYQKTPRALDAALGGIASLLPGSFEKLGAKEKLERFLLGARVGTERAHAQWKRVFTDDELRLLIEPEMHGTLVTSPDFADAFEEARSEGGDPGNVLLKADFRTFLISSCLVKSDITSMQHGLEVRVPFLNRAMIEFAWDLPAAYKVGPFQTKRILRRALARFLPSDIARLPKQGFVPPLSRWLGAELRPVMSDLLSEPAIARIGFLRYPAVSALIEEHLAGKRDHAKKLWALMSLSRFYERLHA